VKATRQCIPCRRASEAKTPANSSRERPKPRPSVSSRIKKVPESLTYWSAERMFPSCIEMNDETAAIMPFLSGQEISNRRL
jgi:hypothetical protein